MNLPGFSTRRPLAVLAVVCLVLILGFVSLTNIPVDLLPEFEFPVAAVSTSYDEAGPEEVENHVTRPLEESLGTVEGIESITSNSSEGSSLIMLEFTWGTDLDFALLEVRESIDLVRELLPDGADNPQVFKFDPDMMPILNLALSGEMEDWELREIGEDILEPRLERVEGVANVDVVGGRQEEVLVETEPDRLAHYGLNPGDIITTLQAENYNVSAGTLEEAGTERRVRAVGEFENLDQMERLVLSPADGERTVLLEDVASVQMQLSNPNTINTFNGETSVGIQIFKQADANTVNVSRGVWNAMEEIEEAVPAGVQINKVMDQADFIMESIWNVVEMGAIGAVLAMLVLFLFMRSIRNALVVALSIPLSIISAFVLMYFSGITINIISLGGLALGLGIMVDSSIVVLENIFRIRETGTGTKEAAVSGTNQVASAITAATITTVVVFLPIVFITGFAAEIFESMALAVSFSLLAALLVALTVVPLLSSKLLSGTSRSGEESSTQHGLVGRLSILFQGHYQRIENFYHRALKWSLRRRGTVIALFLGCFLLVFVLLPFIGTEFLPAMDQGHLQTQVTLPEGSSLRETEDIATRAQESMAEIPEVEDINLTVGSLDPMGLDEGQNHVASMEVMLLDLEERHRSDAEVAEEMRAKLGQIPGAEFSVTAPQEAGAGGPMEGPELRVSVRGDDLEELERLTDDIAGIVEDVPGTREVDTTFDDQDPEVSAYVDRESAADRGLAFAQVAEALRVSLEGDVATQYREAGEEYDVRVQFGSGYSGVNDIEDLSLFSPLGYRVPLKEITEFRDDLTPQTIERYDQVRTAAVEAEAVGRSLGNIQEDIQEGLAGLELPEGYFIDFEGELEMMEEAFVDLGLALLIAIVLVYLVMVAQFESLLHPFLVMFALPQTFTGAAIALLITGRTLNVSSFIGVIMLAGVVVNNSIVMIDFINKMREEGKDTREAILTAAPIRLRPILMTVLTTALAMLPLALGIGSGAEIWAPMATAVIGGLLFSTLLTLLIVPAAYSLMEDLKARAAARVKNRAVSNKAD